MTEHTPPLLLMGKFNTGDTWHMPHRVGTAYIAACGTDSTRKGDELMELDVIRRISKDSKVLKLCQKPGCFQARALSE
jgi:hypothetical protein